MLMVSLFSLVHIMGGSTLSLTFKYGVDGQPFANLQLVSSGLSFVQLFFLLL